MNLQNFMRKFGESFKVTRDDCMIGTIEGLNQKGVNQEHPYLSCYADANIEVGDWIEGKKSSNVLFVIDIDQQISNQKVLQKRVFYKTKAEFEKQDSKAVIIYNFTGSNARVNNNSNDHSTNIIQKSNDDIFQKLKNILDEKLTNDQDTLKNLTFLLSEMKSSQNTSQFNSFYTRFITASANHMTILSPFIPLLAKLVQ